jgi:hypothetical protein
VHSIFALGLMSKKSAPFSRLQSWALFPSDEAVFKLLYLALRNISQHWSMPIPNWANALNQFAVFFEGRVPMGGLETKPFT